MTARILTNTFAATAFLGAVMALGFIAEHRLTHQDTINAETIAQYRGGAFR